jgi:hypothetical protein
MECLSSPELVEQYCTACEHVLSGRQCPSSTTYLTCVQGMVENRRCRDVLFLLLFIAYWVGMFIVCGIAFQSGEASLLACDCAVTCA